MATLPSSLNLLKISVILPAVVLDWVDYKGNCDILHNIIVNLGIEIFLILY
jgi:hypothetical protein